MKQLFFAFVALGMLFMWTAMRADIETDCPYSSPDKLDMLSQRWINTSIEIYNGADYSSVYYDHPVGYFQLNANNTYNRLSNNVPLNGKWTINANCKLELDKGTDMHRIFEILKLAGDSLIIRRKDDNVTYVQHYKTLPHPTFVFLQTKNRDNY